MKETIELLINSQKLLNRVIANLPKDVKFDNLALHCENQMKKIEAHIEQLQSISNQDFSDADIEAASKAFLKILNQIDLNSIIPKSK